MKSYKNKPAPKNIWQYNEVLRSKVKYITNYKGYNGLTITKLTNTQVCINPECHTEYKIKDSIAEYPLSFCSAECEQEFRKVVKINKNAKAPEGFFVLVEKPTKDQKKLLSTKIRKEKQAKAKLKK